MFSFLPAPIVGFGSFLLFALSTAFWCLCIYPLCFVKFAVPNQRLRRFVNSAMVFCAESWIDGNDRLMRLFHRIEWDVSGVDHLDRDHSYLICANHQSWVDIVVLQKVFNRRIPFLRFFLKAQLIYVPLLGLAWWALDFPFMRRHSKEYLQRHPEKRGDDLAATKRACERFRGNPISVLNFIEGTRFTPKKHSHQNSPYQNLLQPKTGGLAFVLEAMGTQFESLLDVTIFYPEGRTTIVGLLCGRLHRVVVRVRKVKIPGSLLNGRYQEDERFRQHMQAWVRELWQTKDEELTTLARI